MARIENVNIDGLAGSNGQHNTPGIHERRDLSLGSNGIKGNI